MGDTLYIIDGHSQIYRAYYAPFRDLTSPAGEPTRATYVFTRMLLRFIEDRRPKYLAMAIDGPAEKLERRKLYGDYKVTRKPMPEDLLPQVRRILQIVRMMGVPILQAEGHEADDVIATLAQEFASGQMKVAIISRDKDLDQLVGENVVLYDPMKDQTLDAAAIKKDKGYRPDQAVEVQTLCGDSIDNIPGIPGVGPKTAAKLIAKYGTAEAAVAHADEQTPKLRENLLQHAATLKLTRQLVTLRRDVPLKLTLEDLKFPGVDGRALRPIFEEMGFKQLLQDTPAAGAGEGPVLAEAAAPAGSGAMTTAKDFDYRCVDTAEALADLAKTLKKVDRLSVDTETTGTRPMWVELVGVSLAWKPGHAVYLPVKAPMGQATLELDEVRKVLGPVLADAKVRKVGQNLKYDMIVLAEAGMELAGELFDTMVAAYVLDATRGSYKLDTLAAEFLHHRCIPIEDVLGKGRNQTTMDAVPVEMVAPYSCEDADVALRLADVLDKKLHDDGLSELFADLEMPLLPVLAGMERAGIAVDPQALKRMETALGKQADVLRAKVIAAAGRNFNPDSPKQLAEVLFGELKLPVLKSKKTGASTDSDVLEQLAVQHELPGLVLDYRKLTKLLSTYLTALAQCIHPRTGRVHTSFRQTGTVTGRLSSSDPNLQNIPIRSEEGRQIRSAFVADAGCVLLSADYSQVELRVLAHFCKDPTLMEAFQDDRDIHRIVAAEVFGVPVDEVTPEQRSRAKTVNFGIIYGQTAHGLSRTLRISRGEAAEFIRAYRDRFPEIGEFLQACIDQAKKNGFVETIFKRRRPIPEIESRDVQRRSLAERLAINTVVQGSAADLIKQAMLNIARRLREEHRPSRMLLQIHDELLFETPMQAVEDDKKMIVEEMAGAIQLAVPLKVEVGVGANWMDAK